ncbi:MAG TPA: helix-turn-helix domain-containing protein [Ignavibacteria bacterium]|nr:helix-turn-helix domain-containing protein [Ignavibacteria bacterium]
MSVINQTTILQDEQYILKLQDLGFKDYESKVFLVLLKGGTLGASEIAAKAKIPRTAVYDILKSFSLKGYCNEIETNKISKFEIINPDIIVDKIRRDYEYAARDNIKKLITTFEELKPVHKIDKKDEDSAINVELIRGFNQHRHIKFIELLKQAKKEIFYMIRLEGQLTEELDDVTVKFLKKGGKINSLYEASLNFKIIKNNTRINGTIEDLMRLCEFYEKGGENLKISDMILPNMTIFDREIVFINIEDKNIPRHNKSDIIIRNSDFASRMIDLFNYYWENSFTVKEYKNYQLKKSA